MRRLPPPGPPLSPRTFALASGACLRLPAFVLLPLFLAPLLAGCVGDGGGGGGGGGGDGGGRGSGGAGEGGDGALLEAPRWSVGDWWNYTATQPPGEGEVGAYTYVVSQDLGPDWLVETDHPEVAFYDALYDISTMGPIRKSDLAGSQGETRVEFFCWPIADGANWTTTWDGLEVAVTARRQAEGVFDFEARRPDGSLHADYAYDAAVRNLRRISFYGDGGSAFFTATLAASGANYTGTLARWTLEEVDQDEGNTTTPAPEVVSFSVEAGVTDLWLSYDFACSGTAGGYMVVLRPASANATQEGMTSGDTCATQEYQGVVPAPTAGSWLFSFFAQGDPATTSYDYTLLKRTLETAALAGASAPPPGAAP